MNNTELLPCPFCGEPIVHTESDDPQFYFECSDKVHCGINFNIYADSEEVAFACMNNRAYKAMLSAAPTAQPEKLDVEDLKRRMAADTDRENGYNNGWNAAIDHLVATYDFVPKEKNDPRL